MKLAPFLSLFFILLLANSTLASSNYITPDKIQVTEYMRNYDLNGQNNSLQLACEIGQYVSEEYGWNCDIRQLNFTKHAPIYLNVFYPAAPNKKGYDAYYGWFGPQPKRVTSFWGKDRKMYYTDWDNPIKGNCWISGVKSYGIVQSYFGNITVENETTNPVDPKPNYTESVEVHDNSFVNSGNNNQVAINNNGSTINFGDSSINPVNNQGKIDKLVQYCLNFSNAHLSNVSFNFWGN